MDRTLTETPLVYPSYPVPVGKRYIVNDVEGTVSSVSSWSRDAALFYYGGSDQLLGSASISELSNQMTVTTCALPVDPKILSVTLTQNQRVHDRIELDLGQAGLYGLHGVPTVKVQCCSDRLVFVDARGLVLVVNLHIDTNMHFNLNSCCVISIPELLQDQYIGAEISSSMVAFPSSRYVLVAMSPFLVMVDLKEQDIEMWSQTQTLQDMKSRTGGILAKASDLILGRSADAMDEDVLDMPPISALCLAKEQDSSCYIFTLHSNATLRRWRLDAQETTPSEVVLLTLPIDRTLPPSSQWSETSSAVALTARVYADSVCAVAIYIKTSSDQDDNTLTALLTSATVRPEDADSTRSLEVPEDMASLVGMEFSSSTRCSLTALMKTDDDTVAFVYYPPSYLSMVSAEPTVTRSTFDRLAQSEQERIWKLSFPISPATDFDEEMHRMDKFYMQRLFRPLYPRGDGTVTAPLAETVRAALVKIVPDPRRHERIEAGCSLELETLLAIQDWRRKEHHQGSTPTRRRREDSATSWTPTSIYDSYVARSDEDADYMDDEVSEAQNLEEESRIAQLQRHEKRWQKLLTAVFEQEQRNRTPLGWSGGIILRAGVTSSLQETREADQESTTWDILDDAAFRVLHIVQQNPDLSSRLLTLEAKLSEIVAHATLALGMPSAGLEMRNELDAISSSAAQEDLLNLPTLVESTKGVSNDDLLSWLEDGLQSSIYRNLPGVQSISLECSNRAAQISRTTAMADCQTRHAACSLYIQCADSLRQLRLGRCLLLLSLKESQNVATVAFREYLLTLAVLWTSAQIVPLPTTGMHATERVEIRIGGLNTSPSPRPKKRLSFSHDTESILQSDAKLNMTTALDVRMIRLSQEMEDMPSAADLASAAYTSTFLVSRSPQSIPEGFSGLLPELGLLPIPSDRSVTSDFPRLALRLMSPFLAFPPTNDSVHTTFARKEAIAECLLIEANAVAQIESLSESECDVLRARACDLLVARDAPCTADGEVLQRVYQSLRTKSEGMPALTALDESSDSRDRLVAFLQQLVCDDRPVPAPEIVRLAMQPTASLIFLPLALSQQRSHDGTRAALVALAESMLRISNLTRRLSILERHTEFGNHCDSSEGLNFLLTYIEETITEMTHLFPSDVYQSMDEYSSLWSFLFRHSCLARDWTKAYYACMNHPVHEQKVKSYSSLVTAMVDAGALHKLIHLSSGTTGRAVSQADVEGVNDCVDLYEIVEEALAQAKGSDFFSSQSLGRQMDYLGYLYAVHASKGNWKRAAQAMEARHDIVKAALASSDENRYADPVDEVAGLNDLVLTSLVAANAIQLINDPSNRFLVAGEVDPYPLLPFLNPPGDSTENRTNQMKKREREELSQQTLTPFKVFQQDTTRTDPGSRLSRFVAAVDLNYRATQEISWKTLSLDGSEASSDEGSIASADDDYVLVVRLASMGYFTQAIRLASSVSRTRKTLSGSGGTGGREWLLDSISFLLRSHIIPMAIDSNPWVQRSDGSMDVENPPTTTRTLSQLLDAADAISGNLCYSVVPTWGHGARQSDFASTIAAGNLIRLLTTSHAAMYPSLVTEVAERFLDLSAELPSWLESLLLGASAETNSLAGLFGRTPKSGRRSYPGDASALLGFYMKRAMYNEACAVVSKTMLGLHRSTSGEACRESLAPSRLPETGDLDFVPYGKIDQLWSIVEQLLHDSRVKDGDKAKLKWSRRDMETALEKHFELLKISEMGMQSARALVA